jgi:ElaB/YqjD/DUF883 family membrane-anchored ribosome-binding protein
LAQTGPDNACYGYTWVLLQKAFRTPGGKEDEIVDATRPLRDGFYIALGFAVLGFQKAQVRRRELSKELNHQREQVGAQLSGAKEQLTSMVRTIDGAFQPVRQDIEGRLDRVEERLPAQAKDVVKTARAFARETEQQVRRAAGVG